MVLLTVAQAEIRILLKELVNAVVSTVWEEFFVTWIQGRLLPKKVSDSFPQVWIPIVTDSFLQVTGLCETMNRTKDVGRERREHLGLVKELSLRHLDVPTLRMTWQLQARKIHGMPTVKVNQFLARKWGQTPKSLGRPHKIEADECVFNWVNDATLSIGSATRGDIGDHHEQWPKW